jgi:hypothetical protein
MGMLKEIAIGVLAVAWITFQLWRLKAAVIAWWNDELPEVDEQFPAI